MEQQNENKTTKEQNSVSVENSSSGNVFADLTSLNSEIKAIKQKLNEINEVKEQWFHKKDEISKKILELIGSVKSSKIERNERTKEVRTTKVERDKLNNEIKIKIEELKKLNDEKAALLAKLGLKADPSKLKSEIDALEMKIQTDVMSYDKEKALNKRIKELKKQFEESKGMSAVLDKIHHKRKELDLLRKDAEQKHQIVQTKASQSQEKHESLLSTSKEIDDLKFKEEEAYKEFFKYKEQFTKLNNELKEKLKILNDLSGKATHERQERKAKREEEVKKTLREKEKDVEEKIKKKQKLTTEDLLVFQGQR